MSNEAALYDKEEEELLIKYNSNKQVLCLIEENSPKQVDGLEVYLERVGYTSFHYKLIFIISIIYFYIGSEFISINIMLSTLEKEWSLTSRQLSSLASSVFIGVFISSILAGNINNRYGRRIPSILACILLSTFSVASCLANSLNQMLAIRIIIGFGIGIIIPGTTSLLTECIPKHNRSFTLNAVWSLYPLGIIYVCYIAMIFTNKNILEWRSVCWISSFTSILVVILSLNLKESFRYLILLKKFPQAYRILDLIGKPKSIILSYEQKELIEKQEEYNINIISNNPLNLYLEGDLRQVTPSLLFLWYSSSLISYGLLYVMPRYFENFTNKDKVETLNILIGSMYILILCPLLRGFISELEFFGRKKTMALGFMGAMLISICCILDDNYLSFKLGSLNFFINISLGLVSVYTSEVYPTRLRSEALGIGNAFTRIGGITAPFICETVESIIYKGSFFVFAFIGFISVIISFRLSRETRLKDIDSTLIEKK